MLVWERVLSAASLYHTAQAGTHLDASHKDLLLCALLRKSGGFSVNGQLGLGGCTAAMQSAPRILLSRQEGQDCSQGLTDGAHFVYRLADDIHDAAQRLRSHRHLRERRLLGHSC